MPVEQLPLSLGSEESTVFETFVAGDNAFALDLAQQAAAGRGELQAYFWGEAGVGKSHLLQAACLTTGKRGGTAAYLPLRELAIHGPDILEGLEAVGLIGVDDLDAVVGQPVWEEALFGLINAVRDAGGRLLFSAAKPPRELAVKLPDLRSRLGWGPVVRLQPLDDAGKMLALQGRARHRGLDLPEDVARFMLRHYPRDLAQLLALLERLDVAAMAAKRRLTVPFLRDVLDGGV